MIGDPGTPADEADVTLRVELTDVRRRSDLADYTGQLQASAAIRITDRDNPPPAGGSPAATAQDAHVRVDRAVRGDRRHDDRRDLRGLTTSADAVTPGVIKEGMRAIWQLGQVQVFDGGADGQASTTPNTVVFADARAIVRIP